VVVMVLERVRPALRGEITRWMLEVHVGVFVGTPPASVRDRLWEKVCGAAGQGGCVLAYSSDTEQGLALRTWGPTRRAVEDWEGLKLVRW
jgi:CRISPR-associated protein Cas2